MHLRNQRRASTTAKPPRTAATMTKEELSSGASGRGAGVDALLVTRDAPSPVEFTMEMDAILRVIKKGNY